MAVNTTLASLSQTASSNGPDGTVDAPSTLDDSIRYHGAFIAQLRDGSGFSYDLSSRQRLMNANFRINQRAVSGTVVLAAGAYGHDRWKAGAGGCTYTFAASGNDTILTISAGSLMHVVEDKNVEGGVYALANRGTAAARIAVNGAATSGAYTTATTAVPLASATATGGQTVTVEFTTGTIDRAQLEPGTVATPFERRPYGAELALCRRYGRPWGLSAKGIWIATTTARLAEQLDTPMRVAPTAVLLTTTPTIENWQAASFNGVGSTITGNLSSPTSADLTINGFTGGPVTTPFSPAFVPSANIAFLSADL